MDQDQNSVGPDLGPNCLQRLSADTKVAASKERSKVLNEPRYEHGLCTYWIICGTKARIFLLVNFPESRRKNLKLFIFYFIR